MSANTDLQKFNMRAILLQFRENEIFCVVSPLGLPEVLLSGFTFIDKPELVKPNDLGNPPDSS